MNKKRKSKNIGKSFFGMPMRWEHKNALKNIWNKNESKVFLPKYFGIGWDINLHALLKKAGLISRTTKTNSKK